MLIDIRNLYKIYNEGKESEVRALDGVAGVQPGTAVTEGQLLISGVEDTETVGARVLAGMGSVTARTWYTLTAAMPLEGPEKPLWRGADCCGLGLYSDRQPGQ